MNPAPTAQVWTIGALLKWTEQFFAQKSVESPRLDAQVLLAHALGCKYALFQRTGQQGRKLLSADPPRKVADPERIDDDRRKQFENLITRGVPEPIVDGFKMVDIEDQHRHRTPGICFAFYDARASLCEAAAVEHAS